MKLLKKYGHFDENSHILIIFCIFHTLLPHKFRKNISVFFNLGLLFLKAYGILQTVIRV